MTLDATERRCSVYRHLQQTYLTQVDKDLGTRSYSRHNRAARRPCLMSSGMRARNRPPQSKLVNSQAPGTLFKASRLRASSPFRLFRLSRSIIFERHRFFG